jgi:hypothetical protein
LIDGCCTQPDKQKQHSAPNNILVKRLSKLVFRHGRRGNSLDRTNSGAGAAVNAAGRVNFVFAVALADRLFRALTSARTASNAVLGNNVRHKASFRKFSD